MFNGIHDNFLLKGENTSLHLQIKFNSLRQR